MKSDLCDEVFRLKIDDNPELKGFYEGLVAGIGMVNDALENEGIPYRFEYPKGIKKYIESTLTD